MSFMIIEIMELLGFWTLIGIYSYLNLVVLRNYFMWELKSFWTLVVFCEAFMIAGFKSWILWLKKLVWRNHKSLIKLFRLKIPKKTQLNKRTFHNLQSHLACWQIKMCTLIRLTICECLVKIQHFIHKCSSIMYENTQKNYRWTHKIDYMLFALH